MSADALPQEIVDQVVDAVEDDDDVSALLSVSKSFHVRAQRRVFSKIDIGRDNFTEDFVHRTDLLAALIRQSAQSIYTLPIGSLIRSFYLTLEDDTAEDILTQTPPSLIFILSTLSAPSSNLTTLFMQCAFRVRHHCHFSRPLWDAYFALRHAPKLEAFGVYNLPLARWVHDVPQLERIYCRFSVTESYWTKCVEHPEAHDEAKNDLELPGTKYHAPSPVNATAFKNLTIISATTSQIIRIFAFDNKGWHIRLPVLRRATLYINTRDGTKLLDNMLRASYNTLELLHLDFTEGSRFSSDLDEDSKVLNIAPFTKLKYVTLSHLGINAWLHGQAHELLPAFLSIVNRVLNDDPSNPSPLENILIDIGWSESTMKAERDLCTSNERMWQELDASLANLLHLQARNPPSIKLKARLRHGRASPPNKERTRLLNKATPLPQTRSSGMLVQIFPEHRRYRHYPEADMSDLLDE